MAANSSTKDKAASERGKDKDKAAKAKAREKEQAAKAKEKEKAAKQKEKEKAAKAKEKAARQKEKEREQKAKDKQREAREKEKAREAKAKDKRDKEKAARAKEKEREQKAKDKQREARRKEKEREAAFAEKHPGRRAAHAEPAPADVRQDADTTADVAADAAGAGADTADSSAGTASPADAADTPAADVEIGEQEVQSVEDVAVPERGETTEVPDAAPLPELDVPDNDNTIYPKGYLAKALGKEDAVTRSTKRATLAASYTTRDHDLIRAWASTRGGRPADVAGTGNDGGAGVLRVEFPDGPGDDSRLEDVDWSPFFATFDDSDVDFLYQERVRTGDVSRFHKFVRADD